mmetsp:Transcript_32169/g.47314  ORF Transcript_32169/g.47314 Transcript_32169/m.47314 type:complete len:455 (+) Transcript_32169:70-1434(+)
MITSTHKAEADPIGCDSHCNYFDYGTLPKRRWSTNFTVDRNAKSRSAPNVPNGIEEDSSQNCSRHFTQEFAQDCMLWVRQQSEVVVYNIRYQQFIVLLIVLNCILLGVATFDFVTENEEVEFAFEVLDRLFLLIFTTELLMQFVCHGRAFFLDGWLMLDSLIVLLSWSLKAVQMFRGLRVIRILRLVTHVPSLKKLVVALMAIVPRMAFITALFAMVFYMFAVMFTEMFGTMYRDGLTSEDYFSRLDTTLFTLFQFMTLDGWSTVSREVMQTHSWAVGPFILFVLISSFIAVNIFVAIICHAVADNRGNFRGSVITSFSADHDDEISTTIGSFGYETPVRIKSKSSFSSKMREVVTSKIKPRDKIPHLRQTSTISVAPELSCPHCGGISEMTNMQGKIDTLSNQVEELAESIEIMQHTLGSFEQKQQQVIERAMDQLAARLQMYQNKLQPKNTC